MNLDYLHRFAEKGPELFGQFNFSRRDMDEESRIEVLDETGLISSGQYSTEEGPTNRWRFKLDYLLPVRESSKFGAGYQGRLGSSDEINRQYEFNISTGNYEFVPQFSHATRYIRNIHSLYSIWSGESGSFGYQAGIRGEYTYRDIEIAAENNKFKIDRFDYFLTFHLSYEVIKSQQLMVSYDRKIDRPRGWWLEPFESWADAYNVRKGNPDLKPEYVDSYELGYQRYFGRNLISAETYYRVTHNKVEFIQTVYSENITLNTVENVGTDYALGTELMLDLNIFKFWNMNCVANIHNYRVEGVLYDKSFSRDDVSWSARFINTLNLFAKRDYNLITGIQVVQSHRKAVGKGILFRILH